MPSSGERNVQVEFEWRNVVKEKS